MRFCLIEKQYKKDYGTQDLSRMGCGTDAVGIEGGDELRKRVKVEIQEFLAFPVVRVKGIFGMITREPAANCSDKGSIECVCQEIFEKRLNFLRGKDAVWGENVTK